MGIILISTWEIFIAFCTSHSVPFELSLFLKFSNLQALILGFDKIRKLWGVQASAEHLLMCQNKDSLPRITKKKRKNKGQRKKKKIYRKLKGS